jgi:hypothetical protein
VNKLEQAVISVLIIITEKIRGAIGLPSVWHRDAMLDHHGVLTKKSESASVLINKEGPQPLHHRLDQDSKLESVLINLIL